MCRKSRGSLGSPRFAPVPVSMRGTTNSLTGRSPEQIAQDHSFVLELPYRVPSLSSPALVLSGVGFTARVSSLFATSPGASTHLEGSQDLDTFRPQVFSTSRRLSPHSGFRACFIPQAASRALCSFRGFHLRAAIVPLRYDLPPCRCVRQPLARTNPDGHRWRPRLRGLHPRRSSRTAGLVVSLPRGRSPHRVLSPPGPDFLPRSRLIRDPPLLKLPRPNLLPELSSALRPAHDLLQRLVTRKLGSYVTGRAALPEILGLRVL